MKALKYKIVLLIVLISIQFGYAQSKKPNYPTLMPQAKAMVKAAESEDFDVFADYMYPPVIEAAGGKAKLIELSKKILKDTKAQGIEITSYKVKPSIQTLRVGKKIYAVLPTETVLKMPNGNLTMEGCMVGVSLDNGKNWKFIRVESKDILRRFVPEVAEKLQIPKQKIY